MSAARELPRRILVAGHGQTGLLAAVALRQALPTTDVVVVAPFGAPEGACDTTGTALPFTCRLHDRLRIDENVLVRRAGASHRLGTRYVLGQALPDRVAIYGGDHQTAEPAALANALIESQCFCLPLPGGATVDHALRWHVEAYRDILMERAKAIGVRYVRGAVKGGTPDANGALLSIAVAGAGEIAADLFIDCTGPQALLASMLPGEWIDWSDRLPARAVWSAPLGPPVLSLDDMMTLTDLGWRSNATGRDGLRTSIAVNEHATQDAVAAALGVESATMSPVSPGRSKDAWRGNVVALGDAAARLEPLGGLNVDMAHRQLALLLDLLPGRTIVAGERSEFNRRAALIADGASDVVEAHHSAGGRTSARRRGARLDTILDRYARQGRVPFFEDMPLKPFEWMSLLGALDVPQGRGALAHAANQEEQRREVRGAAARHRATAAATPRYRTWLESALV